MRIATIREHIDIIRPPTDEAAVRSYIEDLWIPYNRDLESVVDRFALADGVDFVSEELEFWLDRLETESYRGWIAVDGSQDDGSLADADGDFAGFITTNIAESPNSFDCPDRLVICDFYVREPYRGTGLAHELFDRARIRARESECGEFRLDVDEDNERAIVFYEKLGFEISRYEMVASVEGE